MAFDVNAAGNGTVTRSAFAPHPLLRNAHAQTIVASQFRPTPRVTQRIERCELPDGDFIDIAWSGPDSHTCAILLHGLTGGLQSKYALGTARRLHARGIGTVQMQFRGAGDEPNRHDRFYHSGDTADFAWLCDELRRRHPGTRLLAAGWSLGGNVLLKYLGERGDDTPLSGAVAASVPFRLRDGAVRMREGFSRIYQSRLLRGLKDAARAKFNDRPWPVDAETVLGANDFFELDNFLTAPMNGFDDAEHYYRVCSCREYLRAIRRPTRIIHALDDPFLHPDVVPTSDELSPQVTLEVSDHGGHVGFVARGRFGTPVLWLEDHITNLLCEIAS